MSSYGSQTCFFNVPTGRVAVQQTDRQIHAHHLQRNLAQSVKEVQHIGEALRDIRHQIIIETQSVRCIIDGDHTVSIHDESELNRLCEEKKLALNEYTQRLTQLTETLKSTEKEESRLRELLRDETDAIKDAPSGLCIRALGPCVGILMTFSDKIAILHDDSGFPVHQIDHELISKQISESPPQRLIICFNPTFHPPFQVQFWEDQLRKKYPNTTIDWKSVGVGDASGLTIFGDAVNVPYRAIEIPPISIERLGTMVTPCKPMHLQPLHIPRITRRFSPDDYPTTPLDTKGSVKALQETNPIKALIGTVSCSALVCCHQLIMCKGKPGI